MEFILLTPAFYPEITIIVIIALIVAGALCPLRTGGRVLLFLLAAGLIYLLFAGQDWFEAVGEILNLVGL
jgi:hypothetical protein